MCAIAGVFGAPVDEQMLRAMIGAQRHRGPSGEGIFIDAEGGAGLAHARLSIIDLSTAGKQPMSNADGTLWLAFNGEIYNYRELREELSSYPYRSHTDTEVILAAYERWGTDCLEHFEGMFAFAIWDRVQRRLFAARDRFGVKPLYLRFGADGSVIFSSEIKGIRAGGAALEPDPVTWAAYLTDGYCDHSSRTFWSGIESLAPGHYLLWSANHAQTNCWYELASRVGDEPDRRTSEQVQQEYSALLRQCVERRFRADVPVGVNLSGGLDSSLLLGLIREVQGRDFEVTAFTFATGDAAYDETPWVNAMLATTHHRSVVCTLSAGDVPALAASVQSHQDEPFSGIPTLAYALLFESAQERGVTVLMDGQGMDEQWGGYDYYLNGETASRSLRIQGTASTPVRPDCLNREFAALAEPFEPPAPFPDRLQNLQYRDLRYTKIPRALRFNDRVSMRRSTELREPFLDHQLVELALRQPPERKIACGESKYLLRRMAERLTPNSVGTAPKRPLQTPQREWLRGPLRSWAESMIELALESNYATWLEPQLIRAAFRDYAAGQGTNSYFVWQWINIGLMQELH